MTDWLPDYLRKLALSKEGIALSGPLNAAADEIERLRALAAAGVGDYDLKCTNGHDRCYMGTSDDCPYCERVPAAGVGERREMTISELIEATKPLDAHTIERCAQVAERFYHEGAIPFGLKADIAAAIRALKDKP